MVHLDYLPGTFFGPSNLVDLVRHRANHQPDEIAFTYLVDGETQETHMTNRELDRQAKAIGAWLESHGLVGERALLLYPPGLEFIAAFFGCLYGGVVAVPVYPPRRNRSLARIEAIARDADARVALTTDAVLERVAPIVEETPGLKRLTWLATCRVPEDTADQWQMPDVHGDTLAFLQYTSGSTGTPKGVMLDHANLLHNSALIAYAFEHTRSDIGVFWLPSYHDMGLIGGILQPLYIGRPNVLMSPMSFLQRPYRWLAAITRYGAVTPGSITSGGPNFAYDLCVERIPPEQRENLDLSKWAVAFNGAEPVRAETIDRFSEAFGPCGFRPEAFFPCFGLAEATLIVSGGYTTEPPVIGSFEADMLAIGRVADGRPDDEGVRPLVGCGATLPDQRIVIADPDSMTLAPPDRVGEIWVRGPSVAQGYWGQPEATAATFAAYLKDTGEGPFLRTGDLGFFKDRELFVTGRLKDLIIIRGTNHYPQDIELTVQHSHPRLRSDCGAAFTVAGDGGERLVVVHEIERRKQGHLDEVFDAVRRAVSAEHEVAVEAIVLVRAGSIPKTSSGKIQRHACRQAYLAGSLEEVGQWTASQAGHRIAPLTPPERVAPNAAPVRAKAAAPDRGNGAAEVSDECYRVDRFPEYLKLRQNLDLLESLAEGNPYFTVHEGVADDRTVVDGRELINFSSYNYVGMSGDPAVVRAAQEAAAQYGASASASRLVSGERPLHRELEQGLARFVGAEDAVVFVGGHATNESVIGHLFGPGDLVLHDAIAHNSIVQGAVLSGARRRPFAHNDWQAADGLLASCRFEYRRVLLVIEGVYSMDGDIPALPRFVEVTKRHKALLMVDEAHSIGTLGAHGRGIGEHFDVSPADVDLWMGTLSNALGSCGGYIAGGNALVEYLKYTAPGFVFSVAVPPPAAAAALAALRVLEAQPERTRRLQDRAKLFLALAKQRGLNTGMSRDSPVVPVILGSTVHCLKLARALRDRGINVPPILYPAVEESAARLRFFLTCLHTEGQIRYTIDAMCEELQRIDPAYVGQTSSAVGS